MANKKPYTIKLASDGIVSVTFAGQQVMFKTRKVVNSFALELARQLSDRRTGIFHLQDMPDGRLALIMHQSNHTICFKDYKQASMFAEMLYNDTQSRSDRELKTAKKMELYIPPERHCEYCSAVCDERPPKDYEVITRSNLNELLKSNER